MGKNFRLVEYPKKKELAEVVQEMFEKMAPNNARLPGIAGQVALRMESELNLLKRFNDPQGLYARLPMDLAIH